MKINGADFDLGKAAYDIAFAYAKESIEDGFVLSPGDIDNMLRAYLHAYVQVMSKDEQAVKSLLH